MDFLTNIANFNQPENDGNSKMTKAEKLFLGQSEVNPDKKTLLEL